MSNQSLPKYSDETKEVYRQMFKRLDKDESGTLDVSELEKCLQLCGLNPTKQDVEFLSKHFDANRDGKLQIEELVNNLELLNEHSVNGDELMSAFRAFDTDNDGCIRSTELLKILTANNHMTSEEAGKLIGMLCDKYDINKDAKFNYREFVQIFLAVDVKTWKNLPAK